MTNADPDTVPDAMSEQRHAALQTALPVHIGLLSQRRTADVPQDHLEAYVALGWLRWANGRLVVTTLGAAVRDEVVAAKEAGLA
jgi:hypothetical protein